MVCIRLKLQPPPPQESKNKQCLATFLKVMICDLEPFLGGWDYFPLCCLGISAEIKAESSIFNILLDKH